MSAQIASSLDKSLALLFAFADPDSDQRVFTVSALAEQQGMDKAQVSRALATFAKYGLVERLDNRRGYQLGWSVVHMASKALTAQTMSSIYPAMSKLATELEETVHFSIRDGGHSVALAAFEPDRRLYARVPTGRPEPLIGTAVGYALLSRSDEAETRAVFDNSARRGRSQGVTWTAAHAAILTARENGYSLLADERGEQITTVAVPIYDVGNYRGRVYATIGLSAPDDRFAGREDTIVEQLLAVASEANTFLQGKEARTT